MLTLYTAATGNGHRVSIMLEEVGLPYRVVTIDFARQDHRCDALLAANPMGQIPAIVDTDGIALGESSAILRYLARRTGKLLPVGEAQEMEADRWTAVAAGGLQAAPTTIFFARQLGEEAHAPIIAQQFEVIGRYLAMMEMRLSASPFLAGPHYTYADILGFTLINGTLKTFGVAMDGYPAITAWRDVIAARPAVQRGLSVPPR